MRKIDISVLNVGINYSEVQRGVINARSQLISIELALDVIRFRYLNVLEGEG
jgi:hypothetical protein